VTQTNAYLTHPRLDQEIRDELTANGKFVPTITADMIPELRRSWAPLEPIETFLEGRPINRIEKVAPGLSGAPDVALTIFSPKNTSGPWPCLYHIHGGGMILGERTWAVEYFIEWVERHDVAIATVEYRLAPENPDPAPIEDCYAGLLWTAAHAEEINIDPTRLMIVGESSGGGMAAGLTLMARDHDGPPLIGQMLISPMLDDRNNSPSVEQFAGMGYWDKESNQTGWTALLGDRAGGSDVSCYASPARATDHANLPPTFVDAGAVEIFRDEAVAYANAIWAAGGDCELHVWRGAMHIWDRYAPNAAVSAATKRMREDWFARVLKASAK